MLCDYISPFFNGVVTEYHNNCDFSVAIPPEDFLDDFNNRVIKLFELARNNKNKNRKTNSTTKYTFAKTYE